MNRKIAIIFILTIVALGVLYLYSFGPLSGKRIALQSNPDSLKPGTSQEVATNNGAKQILRSYDNKDLAENFYTIEFPQDWQVVAGGKPGSYKTNFTGGTATAELMDVADNTTLELFVLSQEEPRLKTAVAGYKRLDYQKITVGGQPAYQLTFTGTVGGEARQTMRTYITGLDHAGVVELSTKQSDFAGKLSVFNLIINSFHWDTLKI